MKHRIMTSLLVLLGLNQFIMAGIAIKSDKKEIEIDVPNWFLEPPDISGRIVSVGVGSDKTEALLYALDELVSMLNTTVSNELDKQYTTEDSEDVSKNVSKRASNYQFGKMEFSSVEKKYTLEEKTSVNYFSLVSKLQFIDTPDTSTLKHYFSESYNDKDTKHFESYLEVTLKNCTLLDIVKELEQNGVDIYFSQESGDSYYILLTFTHDLEPPSNES